MGGRGRDAVGGTTRLGVIALLLCACGGPPPGPPATDVGQEGPVAAAPAEICNTDGWCFSSAGLPAGLNAVAEMSPTEAMLVGNGGFALHVRGSNWTLVPTDTQFDLVAAWAQSATSVWAFDDQGSILHYDPRVAERFTIAVGSLDPNSQSGACASTGGMSWLVSGGGPGAAVARGWRSGCTVSVNLRLDGSTWSSLPTPAPWLTYLQASTDGGVWAEGGLGLMRWSGSKFDVIDFYFGSKGPLLALDRDHFFGETDQGIERCDTGSCDSSTKIVAYPPVWSGPGGLPLVVAQSNNVPSGLSQWTGQRWQPMAMSGAARQALSYYSPVSASGHWMIGALGKVLHFDGASWGAVTTMVGLPNVNYVWSPGPGEVWSSTMARLVGTSWSTVGLLQGQYPACGSSGSDVWAWSDSDARTFVHFDGTRWTTVAGDASRFFVRAMWATAPNDAWAAGDTDNGSSQVAHVEHWDGTRWRTVPASGPQAFSEIWSSGQGEAWAVGDGGLYYAAPGGTFVLAGKGPFAQNVRLVGFGTDGVWVPLSSGPQNGAMHFSPTRVPETVDFGVGAVKKLWGLSSTDFWIVGDTLGHAVNGTVTRYDTLHPVDISGTAANDVWVIEASRIQHFDGQGFTEIGLGFRPALSQIFAFPTEIVLLTRYNEPIRLAR